MTTIAYLLFWIALTACKTRTPDPEAREYDCEAETYRDAAGRWRWRTFFSADPSDCVSASTGSHETLTQAIADYELASSIDQRVGSMTIIERGEQ